MWREYGFGGPLSQDRVTDAVKDNAEVDQVPTTLYSIPGLSTTPSWKSYEAIGSGIKHSEARVASDHRAPRRPRVSCHLYASGPDESIMSELK